MTHARTTGKKFAPAPTRTANRAPARPASGTTQLRRALAAELTRTGGRGFLWMVAVPLAVALPLLITVGIAVVAEQFADSSGPFRVTSVSTANAVYWVITFTSSIMMVTAAYAHASQTRGTLRDLGAFLFPRAWTTALARWIFYGAIAAITTAVLLVLVMLCLPRLFPAIYGGVDIADAAGIRFLWTVPIHAFAACGIGVAAGAAIRTPAAAVAALLFWVYVVENSINLLPNGYTLQSWAPFLNGVAATGQQMAFLPRFGPGGSLIYFCCVAIVAFALSVLATTAGPLRRRAGRGRPRVRV
ncbi:ABC transporter permease [Nocardia higoensis]|uniref:ABC transporter permease n=1 Tax=Nocardia higoensis TaxID=228599 RepID=UPI0002EC2AB1|nr:ABC transporter permease [Nocardia higoensis]